MPKTLLPRTHWIHYVLTPPAQDCHIPSDTGIGTSGRPLPGKPDTQDTALMYSAPPLFSVAHWGFSVPGCEHKRVKLSLFSSVVFLMSFLQGLAESDQDWVSLFPLSSLWASSLAYHPDLVPIWHCSDLLHLFHQVATTRSIQTPVVFLVQ